MYEPSERTPRQRETPPNNVTDLQQSHQSGRNGGELLAQKSLKALSSRVLQEEKELEECTFKPKIKAYDPKKANIHGVSSGKFGPKFEKESTARGAAGNPGGATFDEPPSMMEKGPNHLEYVYEGSVPKHMPKGYAKSVERLRRHKEAQERARQDEEMKDRGHRYNRDKLDKMKPPSFLVDADRSSRQKQRRNQVLLSIEVKLSSNK